MEKFNKLGIKGRILALLAFTSIAFLSLAGFSIYSIFQVNHEIEILGNQRIPLSDTLSDIRSSTQAIPRFLWLAYAFDKSPEKQKKALNQVDENFEIYKAAVKKYQSFVLTEQGRAKINELEGMIPAIDKMIAEAKQSISNKEAEQEEIKNHLIENIPPVALKVTAYSKELFDIAVKKNAAIVEAATTNSQLAILWLMVFSVILIFAISVVGYLFATRVSSSIMKITDAVADSSTQVSAASEQLSNSAEHLSSSTQEQASALEEASASLTEIAGMVQANVKGAEIANESANHVHNVSKQTENSMASLHEAMSEILETNKKIEGLVKVIEEIGDKTEIIDEIVFKTQILSFNASVEAERAGEHGRGFSVVAQEVGNLAQMSGKAATEIAAIVKNSIREAEEIAHENHAKVELGGKLARETKEKMQEVLASIKSITENTSRIVSASKEQSQGVNQITISIDNLNQSTQQTASTSEESASASAELAAQAESLLSFVNDLKGIVEGQDSAENQIVKIPLNNSKQKQSVPKQPHSNVKEKSSAGMGKVLPFTPNLSSELDSLSDFEDMADQKTAWEKI